MNKTHKFKLLPAVWMLPERELIKLEDIYRSYFSGQIGISDFQPEDDNPFIEDLPASFSMAGNIAVLNIAGPITPETDIFTYLFGGTGLDVLARDFKQLINDENVTGIVLKINSPGGNAFGVQEFSNLVFESRNIKPIFAHSGTTMASAAQYIASAASQTFISDNAVISGSIGVRTSHIDISELEKMAGIKVTDIADGEFKTLESPHLPLSAEGRADIERQINHIGKSFRDDIAKFRNTSIENVEQNMAGGKLFIGTQGIDIGLIDGVISMDGLINKAIPEAVRIQSINKLSLSGFENIIQTGKKDGSTPGQVAMEIVAAKKKELNNKTNNSEGGIIVNTADKKFIDTTKEVAEPVKEVAEDTLLTQWNGDIGLRLEFRDNFKAFSAYMRNEKRINNSTGIQPEESMRSLTKRYQEMYNCDEGAAQRIIAREYQADPGITIN